MDKQIAVVAALAGGFNIRAINAKAKLVPAFAVESNLNLPVTKAFMWELSDAEST